MPDFIYTAQQRVDMERHEAVRTTLQWIVHRDFWADPEVPLSTAVQVLLNSVHKQTRWSMGIADAEVVPLKVRTCFECRHYGLYRADAECTLFNERIDSEIFAAKDCEEYAP